MLGFVFIDKNKPIIPKSQNLFFDCYLSLVIVISCWHKTKRLTLSALFYGKRGEFVIAKIIYIF